MSFALCRQDDQGNSFVMESNLEQEVAEECVKEFTERGHKQTYFIVEQNPNILYLKGDKLTEE